MTRRRFLEMGLRVALVFLAALALPRIFWGDVGLYWFRMKGLSLHHLPYRDFLWEYPPLSLFPALLLAPLTRGSFPAFLVLFPSAMAAVELGTLELLRRRFPELSGRVTLYWYVVGLPICAIAWFRLDWLSVFCATLAVVAVVRGRAGTGALTAGFAAKLWPAAAILLLVMQRRSRAAWRAVAAIAAVVGAWYVWSPSGFRTFLEFRKGSGFQIEGIIGSLSLLAGAKPVVGSGAWIVDPGRWPWLDPAMSVAWLGLAVAVVLVARRRAHDPFLVMGGLVVSLLLSSRLLSPQFLVWPLPFVAVAWARRDRVCGWAFAVATAITLAFLLFYDQLVLGNRVLAAALVLRNVVLVLVAVRLFVGAFRARSAGEAVQNAAPEQVDGTEGHRVPQPA